MLNSRQAELRKMIADHMENGFLDNIIDMFRHDSSLYALTGALIRDERVRVRIGVTALMEELKRLDSAHIVMAQPVLLPLLEDPDPVVRGDAANLIGIVGDGGSVPRLEKMLVDENENVRLIAKEAIKEIGSELSQ